MEISNEKSFSRETLGHIQTASYIALFIAILVFVRMCFTLYNVISYYFVFSDSFSDGTYLRYLGSSLLGTLFSSISLFFLIMFYNYGTQLVRNETARNWEKIFSYLRNYLIISAIISFNWLVFYVFSLLGNF